MEKRIHSFRKNENLILITKEILNPYFAILLESFTKWISSEYHPGPPYKFGNYNWESMELFTESD